MQLANITCPQYAMSTVMQMHIKRFSSNLSTPVSQELESEATVGKGSSKLKIEDVSSGLIHSSNPQFSDLTHQQGISIHKNFRFLDVFVSLC